MRRNLRVIGLLTAFTALTVTGACAPPPAPPSEFAVTMSELAAYEADFCADAQQRLTGLDESTMPLASVGNVVHTDRSTFIASKASLVPLETQTYGQSDPTGGSVWATHRISCKTRSSDHVATAAYPSQPDLACSVLNQRSLDLAWNRLTAEQRADHLANGRNVVLQPDRLEVTGPEWLNPIADEVVNGDSLELTAHALLINFFDPAYASFPETVRGVHYCTVWTPAWAYAWYRIGSLQP